jgi:hypothetical protein
VLLEAFEDGTGEERRIRRRKGKEGSEEGKKKGREEGRIRR